MRKWGIYRDARCRIGGKNWTTRPGKSLDRIDNDGNYESGNIRWASNQEQAQSRRSCNDYEEQARELIRERERKWFEMAMQWNACVSIANGVIPKGEEIKQAMKNLREERQKILPRSTFKLGQGTYPIYCVSDRFVVFHLQYIEDGKRSWNKMAN